MATTQVDTRTGPGARAALLAFAAFVALSAFVVFHHSRAGGVTAGHAETEADDGSHTETAAVMGDHTVRSRAQRFKDADVAALFGHSEIDLTEARLAAGRGTIDVFVMFGQADVRVPSDWTVETNGLAALGSIQKPDDGAETNPGKVLKVDGLILFGELRILRGQ